MHFNIVKRISERLFFHPLPEKELREVSEQGCIIMTILNGQSNPYPIVRVKRKKFHSRLKWCRLFVRLLHLSSLTMGVIRSAFTRLGNLTLFCCIPHLRFNLLIHGFQWQINRIAGRSLEHQRSSTSESR
ncbi:hypothetical protein D3C81_1719540 [compost metagenome]